jgi:hypothetical protein
MGALQTSSIRRHVQVMDQSVGFQIESPDFLVRYGLSDRDLRALLPDVRLVTTGKFVAKAMSLVKQTLVPNDSASCLGDPRVGVGPSGLPGSPSVLQWGVVEFGGYIRAADQDRRGGAEVFLPSPGTRSG